MAMAFDHTVSQVNSGFFSFLWLCISNTFLWFFSIAYGGAYYGGYGVPGKFWFCLFCGSVLVTLFFCFFFTIAYGGYYGLNRGVYGGYGYGARGLVYG